MRRGWRTAGRGARTFLGSLRRDVRGNTLALMAAALLPVAALAGSALDTARLYAVKVRLQQACDAGALAGRKFMTGTGPILDDTARGRAETAFTNNFPTGWMAATAVTKSFVKTSEAQVQGTASATVPMTLMKIFNAGDVILPATCEARFDVADADIMFVLDTTGSMACLTSDDTTTCNNYAVSAAVTNPDGSYSVTEKPSSRIAGLRGAVLNFYDTVTGSADPTTHFRFGFVPYSATTNVGGLLPRSYLATTSWNYQTRVNTGNTNNGSATNSATTNTTKPTCDARAGQTAWATDTTKTTGAYTSTVTTTSWTNANSGTCTSIVQPVYANFRYQQSAINIAAYISSYGSGAPVANPAMLTTVNNDWAGCVEERGPATTATTFSATAPPLDLDVDTVPTDENSRWRPMWPEVIFTRNATPENYSGYRSMYSRYQLGNYFGTYEIAGPLNEITCPRTAQRLATMTRSQISDYMLASNGFRPSGVTYHDTGMTWGTRLISPTGMFAADTVAWAGHNAPNRYIIFLTDGAMDTDEYAYTAHGIEQFDNRVGSAGNETTLTNLHNSRFATACQIAKNRNITIFVISYAQAMTTQLSSCASPGQAYQASDTTALQTALNTIARQVAMLRVSR